MSENEYDKLSVNELYDLMAKTSQEITKLEKQRDLISKMIFEKTWGDAFRAVNKS